MIKVLNIGHSETGGGLQTVFRITNNIKNAEVKVFSAYHSDINKPDINLKRISDFKNPIRKLFSYFFIPQNYFGIKKFLLENEVDIIHLHGTVNLSLGVIMAIKKYKRNAKVILTSHGYGLVCPIYSCYSHNKGGVCTDCVKFGGEIRVIKNKCDRRGYLFSTIRYFDFLINKKITNNYSLYDNIVTPSEYLQKLLSSSRHKFKNINVVSNPIGLESNYSNVSSKKNVITFMGRFSKEKNVSMLIDSFAQVIKDKKYENLKLNILGDGPEKENYINKVEEYGIKSNVYISNKFLNHQELEEKLNESKILFLPSVFPETFGLVLFEGVRYGLIPISLNIGAQAENIKKLGFGYLYENNKTEDINFAIKEVISKYDDLIKNIGRANKVIDKDYSINAYHKNIISFYYESLELNSLMLD